MTARMTLAEAMKPIEGVTCAKCGRTDAVIVPNDSRGFLFCPTCSVETTNGDE